MSLKSRFVVASLSGLIVIGTFAACKAFAADNPPANPKVPERGQSGFPTVNAQTFNWVLLRNEAVQKDLQLTDDEIVAVKKLRDKARKLSSSLSGISREDLSAKIREINTDGEEMVNGMLSAKQKVRLKEIGLQIRGASALADKDMADALKLTDGQVKKIREIAGDFASSELDTVRAVGLENIADAREKLAKLFSESKEKMLAVLNSEQKVRFEKMKGAKIDLAPAALSGAVDGGRNQGTSDSTPKPESK